MEGSADMSGASGASRTSGAEGDGPVTNGPVTVSVARRAKPGYEAEFERFVAGITRSARAFEGHRGAEVFRPSAEGGEWRVVFRFDSERDLERWEASEERRAWYARAREIAADEPRSNVVTGLEAWFTLPGCETITPPPRYKMTLITWLAVFPISTVLFAVTNPVLQGLPLPIRTLLVTAVMVPAMTYAIMPGMSWIFRLWLYPPSGIPDGTTNEAPRSTAPMQDER